MKRKHIALIVINGVSILFFAVMTLLAAMVKCSLPDQHTADRWTDGSNRYAQVSIYTDSSASFSTDSIFMARVNIEKKLIENSLISENENARVMVDSFSTAQNKITLSAEHGNAEANMIATGGDFFIFHPLDLISGYYYSESDLMHDRIMIDEVLAWQLYGSSDISGKPVIIGEKYFFVSGVFRASENNDVQKVYGNSPRVFMPYQGYELLNGDVSFNSYEVCLPDPVTGIGMQMVSEAFTLDETTSRIIENSARYSLKNRFDIISNFGMRSISDNAVVYPYWENAARITEDKSAFLLVMQTIGLVAPVATVVCLLIKLYLKRKMLMIKAADAVKRIFNKTVKKIMTHKGIRKEVSANE